MRHTFCGIITWVVLSSFRGGAHGGTRARCPLIRGISPAVVVCSFLTLPLSHSHSLSLLLSPRCRTAIDHWREGLGVFQQRAPVHRQPEPAPGGCLHEFAEHRAVVDEQCFCGRWRGRWRRIQAEDLAHGERCRRRSADPAQGNCCASGSGGGQLSGEGENASVRAAGRQRRHKGRSWLVSTQHVGPSRGA
jgi:hypothetical protein